MKDYLVIIQHFVGPTVENVWLDFGWSMAKVIVVC